MNTVLLWFEGGGPAWLPVAKNKPHLGFPKATITPARDERKREREGWRKAELTCFSLSLFLPFPLSFILSPFHPFYLPIALLCFSFILILPSFHLLGGLPLPRLGNTPVPVEVIDWPIDRFVSFCLFSASAQGKGNQISASPQSHHKPSSAFHLTSLPFTRAGTLKHPTPRLGEEKTTNKKVLFYSAE